MCQLPRSDRMAKSIWLLTLRYTQDKNNLGKRCNLNPYDSTFFIIKFTPWNLKHKQGLDTLLFLGINKESVLQTHV